MGNPFWLRAWWQFRRERPWSGRRVLLALVAGLAWWSPGWWVACLTGLAIYRGAQVYLQERDRGTLSVSGITAVAPGSEALGRLGGALLLLTEGWVLALPAVLLHGWRPGHAGAFWLLTGLWVVYTTAFGMLSATREPDLVRCCSTSCATILGGTLCAYLLEVLWARGDVSPVASWLVMCLPPSPVALYMLGAELSYLPVNQTQLLLLWLLGLVPLAWVLTLAVRSQAALAVGGSRGSRGVTPRRDGLLPHEIHRAPAEEPPSDLAHALLAPWRENPFYRAYRYGHHRLYHGSPPGGPLAPALVVTGLLLPALLVFSGQASDALGLVPGYALLVCLHLAAFISAVEAVVLGFRAIDAERDASTWPLLVSTGMRPATILGGKFAACFYALSGEWASMLLFWLLLLFTKPVLMLLVVLQPTAIALGILAGMGLAAGRDWGRSFSLAALAGVIAVCI
ncbi:MAG: hypothetical protein AB1758_37770, partial [Candidatus Eremiobacterota bacterium]